MAEAVAAGAPEAAAAAAAIAARARSAVPPPIPLGAPLVQHGAVFGAPRGQIVLQAERPVSLVVRTGAAVVFARELNAGEAWRTADPVGLSVDADVSGAMEVYVAGRAVGAAPAGPTPLSQIARTPAT
jgi:hypothetical protein